MGSKPHTLAVRAERWDAIEKKAWKLSTQKDRVVKPTDVADALLWKNLDELTIEDVEKAKESR